jgi:hypothetical protein
MEAIFYFIPGQGPNLRDRLSDLINKEDFVKVLEEFTGKEIQVTLEESASLSPKRKLYNYYHKVVLSSAIRMFSDLGYEAMDKIKADYLLKAECATSTMIRNGKEEPFLEDKAAMSKTRLIKFVNDCIHFLESNGYEVPDADEYKAMLKYGREMKSVSRMKPNHQFDVE